MCVTSTAMYHIWQLICFGWKGMSHASTASWVLGLLPSSVSSLLLAALAWAEQLPGAVILTIFIVIFAIIFLCTLAWKGRRDDMIYQKRIIAGKTFGARRSPTDATSIEFVEITHATQFNSAEPFEYQGHILRFCHADRVMFDTSRPQDGRIYKTVTAKIIS